MPSKNTDRLQNSLLALAAGATGIFITFSQSHAVAVGRLASLMFCIAIAVISAVLLVLPSKRSFKLAWLPSATRLAVAGFVIYLELTWVTGLPAELELLQYRSNIEMLAFGIALTALATNYLARSTQQKQTASESLVTMVLSVLAALVFMVAPMDDVNAVGMLGAYLVLLAVNWGVAAASPK